MSPRQENSNNNEQNGRGHKSKTNIPMIKSSYTQTPFHGWNSDGVFNQQKSSKYNGAIVKSRCKRKSSSKLDYRALNNKGFDGKLIKSDDKLEDDFSKSKKRKINASDALTQTDFFGFNVEPLNQMRLKLLLEKEEEELNEDAKRVEDFVQQFINKKGVQLQEEVQELVVRKSEAEGKTSASHSNDGCDLGKVTNTQSHIINIQECVMVYKPLTSEEDAKIPNPHFLEGLFCKDSLSLNIEHSQSQLQKLPSVPAEKFYKKSKKSRAGVFLKEGNHAIHVVSSILEDLLEKVASSSDHIALIPIFKKGFKSESQDVVQKNQDLNEDNSIKTMMITHFSSCNDDCICNNEIIGANKNEFYLNKRSLLSKLNSVPVEKFYKGVMKKPRARVFRKKENHVERKIEFTEIGQSTICIPSFHNDLQQVVVQKEKDLDQGMVQKMVMTHFSCCNKNCDCRTSSVDANLAGSADKNHVEHIEVKTLGKEKDFMDYFMSNEEDLMVDSNENVENDLIVVKPVAVADSITVHAMVETGEGNAKLNQEEPIDLSTKVMENYFTYFANPDQEEHPLDLTSSQQIKQSKNCLDFSESSKISEMMTQESSEDDMSNITLNNIAEQNELISDSLPTPANKYKCCECKIWYSTKFELSNHIIICPGYTGKKPKIAGKKPAKIAKIQIIPNPRKENTKRGRRASNLSFRNSVSTCSEGSSSEAATPMHSPGLEIEETSQNREHSWPNNVGQNLINALLDIPNNSDNIPEQEPNIDDAFQLFSEVFSEPCDQSLPKDTFVSLLATPPQHKVSQMTPKTPDSLGSSTQSSSAVNSSQCSEASDSRSSSPQSSLGSRSTTPLPLPRSLFPSISQILSHNGVPELTSTALSKKSSPKRAKATLAPHNLMANGFFGSTVSEWRLGSICCRNSNYLNIAKHVHAHRHQVLRFKCTDCSKKTNNIHVFLNHMKEKHSIKYSRHKCEKDECRLIFPTGSSLKIHDQEWHSKIQSKCKACGTEVLNANGERALKVPVVPNIGDHALKVHKELWL